MKGQSCIHSLWVTAGSHSLSPFCSNRDKNLICSSGVTKLHTNTLNNCNCKSIARPSAHRSYAAWPLLLPKPNYADICTNTTLTYTNYPTLRSRLSGSLPGDVILLANPVSHCPYHLVFQNLQWRALYWEETICYILISKFKSSLLWAAVW